MSKPFLDNYFLFDMSMNRFNRTTSNKELFAREIMEDYDFIGVTERMDESLVVMKILLDLDLNDVLYLSAKGSGGYDDGAYKGQCHYILKSYVSPGMKKFFDSEVWQKRIDGDQMLFNSANKSLDLTIDALGRDYVMEQLEEFKKMKKEAVEFCRPDDLIFPCTQDGSLHRFNHTCLWWDSGCGYRCLDHMKYGDERNPEFEGVSWIDDIKAYKNADKRNMEKRLRDMRLKQAKEQADKAAVERRRQISPEEYEKIIKERREKLGKKS